MNIYLVSQLVLKSQDNHSLRLHQIFIFTYFCSLLAKILPII